MPSQILITMDDLETAVPLNAALEAAGYSTAMFSSLDDARGAVRRENPDLVILTGAVHEPHAVQLAALARDAEISTLALLEPTDSERAERVERLGVTETMMKPARADEIIETARRLIERRRLQERTGIIGESAAIQEVLVKIEQMAPVSSTVLVQGESGTGKELVAKALHDLSPRRGKPFITVNCAALPETLLESELFGHEKGSFTGATERRLGRFELADTGTIFLDEIGEIAGSTQVKLLRVLESRTFFRVGGAQPIKVDVRVIAATNSDLGRMVADGHFREDLFYRLNVIPVQVPPLRDRKEDIPLLVAHFIDKFRGESNAPAVTVSQAAMRRLMAFRWPGNVRQLENAIERAVAFAGGRAQLDDSDLPADVQEAEEPALSATLALPDEGLDLDEFIARIERELIQRSLERTGGNKGQAAKLLNVKRTTLVEKIKRLERM
jgi:DNA-binding NtrC family response regulator